MSNNDDPPIKQWSRLKRDIGVVLWSSFLAASLGASLFFAYFDPQLLARDDDPPMWLADRMTGYTFGFFFFWLIAIVAGMLVAFLLDTSNEPSRAESERTP